VAEALYRIRRSDKLFGDTGVVMVKDLTEVQVEAPAALRRHSYRAIETEPNMLLALKPSWSTFEDYLKDMKSDYRSGIKKQLRDIEQAGLVLESLDASQVEACAQEIYDLYLQVHEKQKLRLVCLEPTWIPALAKRYGEDFRTTVIRSKEGGPLLGFVTCLRDGDGAIGYYIGFDKVAALQAPLYLRLLYAIVESAIEMRAQWVSLGRTALQPKAKLGAKPQPMWCFLRHRIQAVNLVVASLLRVLPEAEDAPERNPFK
jgi:predicted N-acyltransferase